MAEVSIDSGSSRGGGGEAEMEMMWVAETSVNSEGMEQMVMEIAWNRR
jgi:hypothetical protein